MKKILALSALVLVMSCSEEEPSLTASFFKIYDDFNADKSYHPIDVVETVDGYIILTTNELSNTDFNGVQLIKVDEEGNFVSKQDMNDYVLPIGNMYLNPSDSNAYFFAMQPISLNPVLIGINPQLEIEVEEVIGGTYYPLASSTTSAGNLLLLSYDHISLESEISEISVDGSFLGGNSYSIGPGSEIVSEIDNHHLKTSTRPLPFFCGEASPGNYYFHGFYNYSLSLVFTDFSDSPTRVIQGQATDSALGSIMPINNNEFAVAGFQFEANYQLTSTNFPTNSTESLFLPFGNMAELKPYTPSQIISYSGNSELIIFASETKGRQILLNFYDSTNGSLSGIDRVGYLNPFSFSSIKVGSDNSLLILGTTFVAGRFERIVLSKISEGDISSITN